ncbi:Adenylate kinase [Andreprevotia lacus DSM 23236]|jgi:adenylate kinase family enzyme|uniref:Adenylate kinase n=1 Tax=Andreprevotia lacus DSM 23236 TaxID=1121001 RepID=A0A1W1Y0K7_9NEIS|nr:AAA family ATPase [Andreprevotia lacus]SMC29664.1 Adenylate kinase [Andreprevotia lacus DSM 23236]
MQTDHLGRIVVVGTSGAGKTTFARQLAARLGQPYIELDELYWAPGWQPKPAAEFERLVNDAAALPGWVVDGNYGAVRDQLWPRATTIIWLNYPLHTVLWRAFTRTLRRYLKRETLWHGNRESLRRTLSRDSILVWVITTYHRRQRQMAALRAGSDYPHLRWVEFRHPRQAQAWLRQKQRNAER